MYQFEKTIYVCSKIRKNDVIFVSCQRENESQIVNGYNASYN